MVDILHETLHENGYVTVPLLQQDEIAYLNEIANQFLIFSNAEFVSSSYILSKSESDFINEELHRILQPKMKSLFPYLELLGGTLATKINGNSVLKAHSDWTIVDESKFNSYNLWIPLVDTNKENGTLGLISGSHLWNNAIRGMNIPNLYEKFTCHFLEIGDEPNLSAGTGILYNHKLVHYSRPNKTQKRRNVAIIGMKDKVAALQVSFTLDQKKIETYQATQDDFYQFNLDNIIKKNKHLNSTKITKHYSNQLEEKLGIKRWWKFW